MRFASIFRLRLRSIFSRNRVEAELDEELCYHLERQVEEEVAAGRPQDEARYAALREIKNLQQRKEECRDMRNISYLEDFAADIRHAGRQMLKDKSFFAIAAVTLALGIGANTAIFSAVDGVLLRPFPYRQAARLASLWCSFPAQGIPKMGCALPDWHEIAARNHSFEGIANYYYGDINITNGRPERISGVYATSNLFPLLGVKPALGRTFSPSEEVFGKNRVVVLSDSLWRDRFGGRSSAIGEMLRLNGELYAVIGVMRPDFQFPNPDTKLWAPMSFALNDNMADTG